MVNRVLRDSHGESKTQSHGFRDKIPIPRTSDQIGDMSPAMLSSMVLAASILVLVLVTALSLVVSTMYMSKVTRGFPVIPQ